MSILNNGQNNINGTTNTQPEYNFTQKNLNNLFKKAEQFNFSVLLNSDRESLISNPNVANDNNTKTPEATGNGNKITAKINFSTINANKQNIYQSENNENIKFNIPNNKYQLYYLKLKNEEAQIKDIINYASILFDLKEYLKCSYVLRNYANAAFPTAMFLFFYSEFLIIQQKTQEELLDNSELGSKYHQSKEMFKLMQTIQTLEQNNNLDTSPFMLYLYGVILKELKMTQESKEAFLKSLNNFPFLWSAWTELSLISKQQEIVKFD